MLQIHTSSSIGIGKIVKKRKFSKELVLKSKWNILQVLFPATAVVVLIVGAGEVVELGAGVVVEPDMHGKSKTTKDITAIHFTSIPGPWLIFTVILRSI